MKWIFHFDSLEIKTVISKEIIKKLINEGIYILYFLGKITLYHSNIYTLCAIDLFLNYISYNYINYDEYKGYYFNCIKIILLLYEDDDLLLFSLIEKKISVDKMIMIQKEILVFYDYNFNMKNIIFYMSEMDKKECLFIGKYISNKIKNYNFLILSPEEKINKILSKL
jgi:hypothetical protein